VAELGAAGTSTLSSALDGGGDGRFAKAEENVEQALAAQTVGLVSAEDFRERREAIEAESAGKREREERERRERKQAKKAKREQQERRGLSFVEDDES
jgi:FtsZ-binding cell division protein ZapB